MVHICFNFRENKWYCYGIIGVMVWSITQSSCQNLYNDPRVFNPHPYQHQFAKMLNPGPVVFPTSPDEGASSISNRYNIITLNSVNSNPEAGPYPEVARKIKFTFTGQSEKQDNEVDSEVYRALGEHGARVLSFSPQDLQAYGGSAHIQQKKNYAFSYKVLDRLTGDDFSHAQTRNAKATSGEYRVKLPDGRLQIVSYKADKNGYKADVKYETGAEESAQNFVHAPAILRNSDDYVSRDVSIQRVPVRELEVTNVLRGYDYLDVPALRHQSIPIVKSPNVEIYTSNARDYHTGNFIPTTQATPIQRASTPIRYTSTPVPPTAQPHVVINAERGLINPNQQTYIRENQQVISSTFAPIVVADDHHNIHDDSKPVVVSRNGVATVVPELPEGIYIVGGGGSLGKKR
ncbi:uncharacterized protein LOC132698187 [Cylas formicarius]|uniref:uncharacterized protein LOC132698187 n=1 Tax=Cylas formicarius TaxID=197179 RepID=UPI0029585A47|nr:uncharacterized protein LOC132698187 [Cylas formicarius]